MAILSRDATRPELDDGDESIPTARPDQGPAAARTWIPSLLCGLVLVTSLAVASMSLWLVPPYLVLMGLLLADSLPKSLVDKTLRRGRVIATNPGAKDRTEAGAAEPAEPVGAASPPADSEATGDSPEDDAGAAPPTATRSKKKPRSRARKAKAIPSEPTPATWIQVAPGKFVRVEGPDADPIPPPGTPPPAGPADATDRPEPDEDLREECLDPRGASEAPEEAATSEVDDALPADSAVPTDPEDAEEDSEAHFEVSEAIRADEAENPTTEATAEVGPDSGDERPFPPFREVDEVFETEPPLTDEPADEPTSDELEAEPFPLRTESVAAGPPAGADDSARAGILVASRASRGVRRGLDRSGRSGRDLVGPRVHDHVRSRPRAASRVVDDAKSRVPRVRGRSGFRRRGPRTFPPRSPPGRRGNRRA